MTSAGAGGSGEDGVQDGANAFPLPQRNATGLVGGWAVRDGAIYAVLSTNVVTLSMVEFAYSSFIPRGQRQGIDLALIFRKIPDE